MVAATTNNTVLLKQEVVGLVKMTESLPNCLQCNNYFITHDPAKPYGCRALAFKSKINPARLVYESSGMHCQLFTARKRQRGGSGTSTVA
jgi:hypothetical protein